MPAAGATVKCAPCYSFPFVSTWCPSGVVVEPASTPASPYGDHSPGASGIEEPEPDDGSSGRLVIEFAGTPRAGKTSAMHGLSRHLRSLDLRVHLIEERAGSWPFRSRRHPHFSLWTATATSALMLEAVHAEADVVLVDRGLFDSLCWMDWYRRTGDLTEDDHEAIERFLRVAPLRELVHLVFVMTVAPDVALQRELLTRLTGRERGPGTIVNTSTLLELNASIAAAADRHRGAFNLHELDTTATNREQTLETVAGTVHGRVGAGIPSGR